jgi:hypothetical protein
MVSNPYMKNVDSQTVINYCSVATHGTERLILQ